MPSYMASIGDFMQILECRYCVTSLDSQIEQNVFPAKGEGEPHEVSMHPAVLCVIETIVLFHKLH